VGAAKDKVTYVAHHPPRSRDSEAPGRQIGRQAGIDDSNAHIPGGKDTLLLQDNIIIDHHQLHFYYYYYYCHVVDFYHSNLNPLHSSLSPSPSLPRGRS
jgi:hypothetical protein